MELRIATPCPKSWDDLVGNHRVRYCSQCHLNVYNLAEIPRTEVEALIRKKEGRFCGRLYVQPGRKASTRECPAGRDQLVLRRVRNFVAVMLIAAFGWVCRSQAGPVSDQLPPWIQDLVKSPPPPPPPEDDPTIIFNTGHFVLGEIADFPCPTLPPAPQPPVPQKGRIQGKYSWNE